MLSIRRPTTTATTRFLGAQEALTFTYGDVGSTNGEAPPLYVVDHTRAKIGMGDDDFVAATAALKRWDQFRLGWVEACPTTDSIEVGGVVAVVARTFGLWWMNACRIIYTVDETAAGRRRWGFAYGTLPGHAEMGEERFLIELDLATHDVWYDILAYSRPRHLLAKVAYPIARRFQKKFARESVAAMKRAVSAARPAIPTPAPASA